RVDRRRRGRAAARPLGREPAAHRPARAARDRGRRRGAAARTRRLPGRAGAGMLIKLGERRQVDIAQSSAELLGDPREGTAVRNATLTAATLLALKLAWRKFFALLAIGRRAEDMVTTFQLGTLFDHYCCKLHVGGEIDRTQAAILRFAI